MRPYQITVTNDHPSILNATHIVMSPGLRPRRVVLRHQPGEFIVHREYLNVSIVKERRDEIDYEVITFEHDSFDSGTYFNYNENIGITCEQARKQALASFEERSKRV